MRSTFMGLETARRAIFTQQSALYTTSHNIANANTEGYTRQRVNFTQTKAFPSVGIDTARLPGQMGTGVQAGSVQRIREDYLDVQYRNENNKFGFWNARSNALTRIEDVMNEPSDTGLAKTLDKFWNALQDLSVNPEDSGARSVVRQRGIAVADTFNYLSGQLEAQRGDLGNQIDLNVKSVNSLLTQINQINEQISSIEPHGYLPNDLYDTRDLLVDQLSSLVNIKVSSDPSGGLSSSMAEGKYTIEMVDSAGKVIGTLVDGKNGLINEVSVSKDPTTQAVTGVKIGDKAIDAVQFSSKGDLLANIQAYGYLDANGKQTGDYPDMLASLDLMAFRFAQAFNSVHQSGWSITEINNGQKQGFDFFAFEGGDLQSPEGAASKLKVSDDILKELNNIAASSSGKQYTGSIIKDAGNQSTGNPTILGAFSGITTYENPPVTFDHAKIELTYDGAAWKYSAYDKEGNPITGHQNQAVKDDMKLFGLKIDPTTITDLKPGSKWSFELEGIGLNPSSQSSIGDGSNGLALANVKDMMLDFNGSSTSIMSFYQGVIGELGVNAQEANRMTSNSINLVDTVQFNRSSVSSVSLDEEMTNMIQFQHAYSAAARQITAIDEMLDTIINGMGRVGR
ncbi:flagellar hook-associated protein FlgK [Cytobacillus purgationiresistens]|uniref:Flagellar hook-associated protein 1 n=1 Tax=Cytobacillus purgationiresistens TaxID=863449 RepID=A0ABU0ACX0_9BACI|nr:flagellar hook-associated protein FlgK [Cytobacillus purgationiresistens]MDQ0269093.1 flagellar hook-associated protein 1 FlgK [Cytobacillus purgationiresistens]